MFLTLALPCSYLFAQDWVKMMHDPNVNVRDVQKAFHKWADEKKNQEDAKSGDREEETYALFKRWEAYMVPRTYPSGVRPSPALVYNERNRISDLKQVKKVSGTANWVYAGNTAVPISNTYPEGGDGRINRIRFYPGNSNIMYGCAPTGGLWKSIDGGAHWATNTDNLPDLATSDVAIDPKNPNIMYLLTGDGDGYNGFTVGILRTIDGGNTWKPTGLSYTLAYSGKYYLEGSQLLLNPDSTNLLYAATTFGLWKSSDSGASWKQIMYDDIRSMNFLPNDPSIIYAGSYTGKFYRSADYGNTFTQITAGLPDTGAARMSIGVSPADPARVYVLVEDSTTWGFYGLYMSTDSGKTFVTQSTTPNIIGYANDGSTPGGYGWYTLSIAVSPTNADSLFIGGVNVWRSTNKGVTWALDAQWTGTGAPYVHADIHHITFLPGSSSTLFIGCDGGMFKSADKGVTWSDISNDLEIGELYSIGLSANTPGLSISGWQDNGCSLSQSPWSQVAGGDGEVCFIDYTNDLNLFASSQNGYLIASTDGGVTFNTTTNGITESGPWTTRWMQDPQNYYTLFAGFKNVWISTSFGGSWYAISSWGTSSITALQVAPSNDQYIYAAQSDSIFMTTNQGGTWTCINGTLPLSTVSISAIAVSASDPKHVWVTFSGYNAGQKVYESVNGGSTWKNVSGILPNLPVNCIVYHPGTHNGVYVGTDLGVYYSDSITKGWVSYNTGLPNVMIDDIKIYPGTDTLVAATYGRGIWKTFTYVAVGVNSISKENNSITVYPNPTNGEVGLQMNIADGQYTLSVSNVLGQNLYSRNIKVSGQYRDNLDMSAYGKGIYFISIEGGNTKAVKKILVD